LAPAGIDLRTCAEAMKNGQNDKTLPLAVNEFYKKECQEKKLCLDRSRDLFLEIQPTLYMPRWRTESPITRYALSDRIANNNEEVAIQVY
jgi:hypothetical protein